MARPAARPKALVALIVLIPAILGAIAYFNLKAKGALAQITVLTGNEATLQPAGSPDHNKASVGTRIQSGDRFQTGPGTTATLEFADGTQVEVSPESRIQIEKDEALIPPQTSLQVLVGQVKTTQTGSGRLIVITDQRTSEVGALAIPESETVHADETGSTSTTTSTTTTTLQARATEPPAGDTNSLPTEYIESIIRGQRGHISRCFSDLLRKNSQAHGRMDLSLTIEPSGHATRVHILGSTIADPTFQQCISGIFERLQFKSFQGESIIVNYPLQFQ